MPAVVDPNKRTQRVDPEAIKLRLEALPSRLRAEIERRDLKIPDLAGQIGTTPQAVRKWVVGKALPSLPQIVAIAEVLGLTLDWLIDGRAPAERAKGTRKA